MGHYRTNSPASGLPPGRRSCVWIRSRIQTYARWDLPEVEFEAVEEHLRSCPACAAAIRAAEMVLEISDPLPAGSSSPDTFVAYMMTRIRNGEVKQVRQRRRQILLRATVCLALLWAGWGMLRALASADPSLKSTALTTSRDTAAALSARCTELLVQFRGTNDSIDCVAPPSSADVCKIGDGCPRCLLVAGKILQLVRGCEEPTKTISTPSIPTVADTVPGNMAIDLGMTDQLQEEFAETLALLELRAMIPATEKELEAWARREYPVDMWLHDLLREQHGYQESWQHLLRESGAFLRFDYPLSAAQPNCRPSISALQRVAEVAQFALTLTPDGDIALPEHDWAEGPLPIRSARLEKTVATTAAGFPAPPPPPADYARRIAENDGLAKPVVAYLLISGRTAEAPLASLSPKWNALLMSRLSATSTADGCSCCPPTFAARFQALLEERQALIQSITPEADSQTQPTK